MSASNLDAERVDGQALSVSWAPSLEFAPIRYAAKPRRWLAADASNLRAQKIG
jgi:hypothetical protein